MSDEIETLKAIRDKETESQEKIESAKERGSKIVKDAEEEGKKLLTDAETNGKKFYDDFLNKEKERTALEIEEIEKKFADLAMKLKTDVSEDVLNKIVKHVMENND